MLTPERVQLSQADVDAIYDFLSILTAPEDNKQAANQQIEEQFEEQLPQYEIKQSKEGRENLYAKYFDDERALIVPIMVKPPNYGDEEPPELTEQIIDDFIRNFEYQYPNHSFVTIVNDRAHTGKQDNVQIKDFNAINVLNQYWKIVKSYNTAIPDFYVFPKNTPYNYKDYHLRDAIEGNCVLNEVEAAIDKMKLSDTRITLRNKLIALKLRVEREGGAFTKEHMKEIQKMGIPMTIYHNGGIWHEAKPTTKAKIGEIKLFAHNGHATRHVPLGPVKSVNYINRKGWNGSEDWSITNDDLPDQQTKIYCSSVAVSVEINPLNICDCNNHMYDILETGIYDATPFDEIPFVKCNCKKDHPPVLKSDLNITAYQTGTVLNKCYRPPAQYENDPEYFYCTNELSFQYKLWVKKNNLVPFTGIHYDIAKAADHHLTSRQFKPIDPEQLFHSADMNKAYRSFPKSRYYNKYGLPVSNPNLVKFDQSVYKFDKPVEKIVKLTGWSCISNIRCVHTSIDENSTHWIQEGGWYWHASLQYILDLKLALFDIDATTTVKSKHIEFPFKSGTTLEDKKFNNQFIGKLIQRQSNREIYTARDENELGAIVATAQLRPDYIAHVSYTNNIVEIEFAVDANRKSGLHHIHSAILSYVQIEMIDAMIRAGQDTIVAYNTDGFYTTVKADLPYTDELFGFKYAHQRIKGSFRDEADKHIILPLPEHIPSVGASTTHTLTYGPAGSGKSRQVITNTYHDAIFLFPTHTLTADGELKAKNAKLPLPCMTVQKYYFENKKNPLNKQKKYSNVYIDEVTMISKQFFNKIMQHAEINGYNVHFIGDIDENGLHQLPPVSTKDLVATPLKWSDFNGFHRERIVGDIRRQSAEDCVILDSLRGLDYDEQLVILKQHVQSITQQQAVDLFDANSIILTGTNKRGAELNSLIYKKNMPQIRVRTTKKYNGMVKGQMTTVERTKFVCHDLEDTIENTRQAIYLRRESNIAASFPLEMMFAGTTDAVQGCTHDGKIFIDVSTMDRENLLYTAATRCKKLSDVFLIY